MEVVDHFVYSCSVDVVTLLLKMTPSFDYSLPYCWRHSLTHLFNHKSNTLYDGSSILYSSSVLCSWSLHEHAHGVLMSICAHESFMSMLMKLSCARARGGVTRTTTLGQYAARRWSSSYPPCPGPPHPPWLVIITVKVIFSFYHTLYLIMHHFFQIRQWQMF